VLKRGLPPEVAAGASVRDLVDLGLRYDLTVPLTRFYGTTTRRCRCRSGRCRWGRCGGRTAAAGRYRQFYQCDIDMIGEASVLAEAELIEATSQALASVGLTGTTIRVSDAGS